MMNDPRGKDASATHGAYLAIREKILTGDLPAGQKLKIERLREMLNTGASPVREALSLLTSDLLVERIDQRGFRAAPANKANFEEILTLRCVLEDMALRRSIERSTRAWEDRLVLAHHHMTRATDQGTAAFEEAHKTFHMTLLDNAALAMLERYCSQLYDLNIRYRYLAARGAGYRRRDVSGEHRAILDAALEGDADRASARLLDHYRLTGDYLVAELDDL